MKKQILIGLILINLILTMNAQTWTPGTNLIWTSGRVGIGTNNPLAKLHIDATPSSRGSQFVVSENNSNRHLLYTSTSDGRAMYYMYNSSGTLTNLFDTYGKSYINGGNFGIGTAAPSELLELSKDLSPIIKFNSIGDYIGDIGALSFVMAGTEKAKIVANRHTASGRLTDLQFFVGGGGGGSTFSEKMRIGYNGTTYLYNETAPATIELNRKYDELGDIGVINFVMAGSNLAAIKANRNIAEGRLTDLIFYVGSSYDLSEKMRIKSNGSVGIGTSNPQNKLDVNGTIHAKEVKVDLTGWADFVFDPSYKLRSLSEVETFIKQHKHLPDISPATDMQTNGASLGEMQTKLLQKLEESTLYLIEQAKQIEALKKENQELRVDKDKQLAEQQQMLLEMKKRLDTLEKK